MCRVVHWYWRVASMLAVVCLSTSAAAGEGGELGGEFSSLAAFGEGQWATAGGVVSGVAPEWYGGYSVARGIELKLDYGVTDSLRLGVETAFLRGVEEDCIWLGPGVDICRDRAAMGGRLSGQYNLVAERIFSLDAAGAVGMGGDWHIYEGQHFFSHIEHGWLRWAAEIGVVAGVVAAPLRTVLTLEGGVVTADRVRADVRSTVPTVGLGVETTFSAGADPLRAVNPRVTVRRYFQRSDHRRPAGQHMYVPTGRHVLGLGVAVTWGGEFD